MDFILGFSTGAFIFYVAGKKIQLEWAKEIEKLKDFETWKKWKNHERRQT